MLSGKHSLTHKKDPCWPLICQGLCISTGTQQEKSQEVSPHLSPSWKKKKNQKKYFSKGLDIFKRRENPCRSEDNSNEFSTELLSSVAALGDLPASHSSICIPNRTYHHHSWATWWCVHSLLVQLCTFLHLPEENCSPWEASNRKLQKFRFFVFLCPTLLETIQDLRFWGWILLSKVTAVRLKEQDPGKWAQNIATSFLCPGSARDANAAGRVALLKGKKWVCFMQQEHLRLVISKTNSTGDERTVPFTLLLQYTFAVIFPTRTSTRLHKKEKHLRHFKLNKAKCICITAQQCEIELAVKRTDWSG